MKPKPCNRECGATIQMDNKDGRWLPYNMDGTVHKCNAPKTIEDKDDHGNESFPPPGAKKILELTPEGMELLKEANKEFVDHTQSTKGQSKVKIFFNQHNTDVLAIEYNEFLSTNNGKIKTQGAQFQMTEDGFAIALYYEETN